MEVTSRMILSECFIRNLHGELDKQYPGGAVGVMWDFMLSSITLMAYRPFSTLTC